MSQQDVDEMLARKAARGGNSGGGSAGGDDGPPADPNEYDDEFAGTELDPAWTVATTGTAPTTTFRSGGLYLDFPAANGEFSITKDFVPGAVDFSVAAKFSVREKDNYQGAMLIVQNADESLQVRIASYTGNALMHIMPAFTEFGTIAVTPDGPLALAIKRVGGLYTGGVSRDGIGFRPFGTPTEVAFTVAKVKLVVMQSGATSKMREAIHWLRVNDVNF